MKLKWNCFQFNFGLRVRHISVHDWSYHNSLDGGAELTCRLQGGAAGLEKATLASITLSLCQDILTGKLLGSRSQWKMDGCVLCCCSSLRRPGVITRGTRGVPTGGGRSVMPGQSQSATSSFPGGKSIGRRMMSNIDRVLRLLSDICARQDLTA